MGAKENDFFVLALLENEEIFRSFILRKRRRFCLRKSVCAFRVFCSVLIEIHGILGKFSNQRWKFFVIFLYIQMHFACESIDFILQTECNQFWNVIFWHFTRKLFQNYSAIYVRSFWNLIEIWCSCSNKAIIIALAYGSNTRLSFFK